MTRLVRFNKDELSGYHILLRNSVEVIVFHVGKNRVDFSSYILDTEDISVIYEEFSNPN